MRQLVVELEEAEFKRLQEAAYTVPVPDYVRAVVNAVLDYRESDEHRAVSPEQRT